MKVEIIATLVVRRERGFDSLKPVLTRGPFGGSCGRMWCRGQLGKGDGGNGDLRC